MPDPTLLAPGDAIVRVQLTAVCGSDLHPYHGREMGLDGGTVMGHEFLGEVVETGVDVSRWTAGDQVVSPFTTSCGECFFCRTGLTCRCTEGELFGWVEGGSGLHGAQAEYVRVPLADSTLVAVPEGARKEEALLAGDVFATGFFCADSACVGPGSTVVVLGCGPVGLMAILGARELGAERIFAVDSVAARLGLARSYGAEPLTLDGATGELEATIREATAGRGADVALEAVGSPEAARLAIDLVRPGGTVSAAGVHTEDTFAFSPGEAYDKNLTYHAGRCPARHYMDRLLPLIRERKYDLSAMVSHRLSLRDGPRAYDLFDRKLEGCTKVILSP